jgi:hypothetical protein
MEPWKISLLAAACKRVGQRTISDGLFFSAEGRLRADCSFTNYHQHLPSLQRNIFHASTSEQQAAEQSQKKEQHGQLAADFKSGRNRLDISNIPMFQIRPASDNYLPSLSPSPSPSPSSPNPQVSESCQKDSSRRSSNLLRTIDDPTSRSLQVMICYKKFIHLVCNITVMMILIT